MPLLMPCEVEQFLDGSFDLDTRVVGFGVAGGEGDTQMDKSGRKREQPVVKPIVSLRAGIFVEG